MLPPTASSPRCTFCNVALRKAAIRAGFSTRHGIWRSIRTLLQHGLNPLVHFEQHGRLEERYPTPPSEASLNSAVNYRRWIERFDRITDEDRAAFRGAVGK